MPGTRAISSALAVVTCAAALSACGGDDEGGPIPQEAGNQLIGQLDDIELLVEQGECSDAQQLAVGFANTVNELPAEVDGELREALVEASGNLEALTEDSSQCDQATGTTGETGEVAPEPPEETTTTETTETTTEEPPADEDGRGGPPEDTPGQGDPGGDDEGGGSIGGDDSSGGIGSDG